MASEVQMGGTSTDRIFLGTDFTRRFHVLDLDTDPDGLTAKNVVGWDVTLDIRKRLGTATVLYSATLTIEGVFNSVASSNTQRLVWTCLDTHLTPAIFGVNGGTFPYSVKRTTDGVETILQYGEIVIQRATQV